MVSLRAQTPLERQIATIAEAAQGKVAVACSLPGTRLACDLRPDDHPPMQSVFKLPLAVTVLHQVEHGRLSFEQPVRFRAADRIPGTWSPLQDDHPGGEVDVPLQTLLQLAVCRSDNVAADLLLRQVGGPAAVNTYLHGIGVEAFHLDSGEDVIARDEAAQYRSWLAPRAAVDLLRLLADRSPLNAADTTLLLRWMRETIRNTRIKGDLPPGVEVAHRSGTSGTVDGMAAATNDLGLITLPDGRLLALAVFLTDARADDTAREQVIARIGRAVYDAALQAPAARTR